MKLTKHRQEILTHLQKIPNALSAADIHAALPQINLVTIYRTLEYLTTAGTIKKLYFDEGEAQYEWQEDPHHHAICTTCARVIHFTVNDSELVKEFSLPGFSITNLDVTLRGVCKEHSSPSNKKPRAQGQKQK